MELAAPHDDHRCIRRRRLSIAPTEGNTMKSTKDNERQAVKVRSGVRAGGVPLNHNERRAMGEGDGARPH
jgi:hypothetical protein